MKDNKFSAWLSTFIFCFLFWLLLTWSVALREILIGLVVSAVVAAVSARFFIQKDAFYLYHPVRLLTLIFYLVIIFPIEVIKANIAMAAIVLSPDLKNYKPGIIRVPAAEKPKSLYGQALLSNCITLTPGTITMDVIKEDDVISMYVQWLIMESEDAEEAGEIIKGRMEKWIGRVFG